MLASSPLSFPPYTELWDTFQKNSAFGNTKAGEIEVSGIAVSVNTGLTVTYPWSRVFLEKLTSLCS
jgi:hypothetical protein